MPSKSTLQRFANWFSTEEIGLLNTHCLGQSAQDSNPLGLEETLDLETLFMDSTCVKANIHFPVDWVLLRDATLTIIKAIR